MRDYLLLAILGLWLPTCYTDPSPAVPPVAPVTPVTPHSDAPRTPRADPMMDLFSSLLTSQSSGGSGGVNPFQMLQTAASLASMFSSHQSEPKTGTSSAPAGGISDFLGALLPEGLDPALLMDILSMFLGSDSDIDDTKTLTSLLTGGGQINFATLFGELPKLGLQSVTDFLSYILEEVNTYSVKCTRTGKEETFGMMYNNATACLLKGQNKKSELLDLCQSPETIETCLTPFKLKAKECFGMRSSSIEYGFQLAINMITNSCLHYQGIVAYTENKDNWNCIDVFLMKFAECGVDLLSHTFQPPTEAERLRFTIAMMIDQACSNINTMQTCSMEAAHCMPKNGVRFVRSFFDSIPCGIKTKSAKKSRSHRRSHSGTPGKPKSPRHRTSRTRK